MLLLVQVQLLQALQVLRVLAVQPFPVLVQPLLCLLQVQLQPLCPVPLLWVQDLGLLQRVQVQVLPLVWDWVKLAVLAAAQRSVVLAKPLVPSVELSLVLPVLLVLQV